MERSRRWGVGVIPCDKGAILIVTERYKSLAKCRKKSHLFRYIRLYRNVTGNVNINALNTKRRPLYLKTQFVPRSKHFSSRL